MLNNTQLANLRIAAAAAFQNEQQTEVPCELTVAQWALESGWGKHSPENNCFGIKYHNGASGRQLLHTTEYFTLEEVTKWVRAVEGRIADPSPDDSNLNGSKRKYVCSDWFATFPTLADCFNHRTSAILLKGLYANFLGTYKISKDLITYISNVAKSYATDPDYANKILAIISQPEVVAALNEARQA